MVEAVGRRTTETHWLKDVKPPAFVCYRPGQKDEVGDGEDDFYEADDEKLG